MKITTVQIRDGKVISSLVHNNMKEAENHVTLMPIARRHSSFAFENQHGTIVKVLKPTKK